MLPRGLGPQIKIPLNVSATSEKEKRAIELLEQLVDTSDSKMYLKLLAMCHKKVLVLPYPIDNMDMKYLVIASDTGEVVVIHNSLLKGVLIEKINEVFSSALTKIFFDIKIMLHLLAEKNIDLASSDNFSISTAHQLISAGKSNCDMQLGDLIKMYLPIDKRQTTQNQYRDKNPVNKQIIQIFMLAEHLEDLLSHLGLSAVASLELDCIPVVFRLGKNGITFDTEKWKSRQNVRTVPVDYEKYVNPTTGRIHATYNQLGSATGRLTCSNPNLQGVPRLLALRSCFVPAQGNVFINADYSQVELRIVAEISRDQKMIDAYANGIDLHKLTAQIITGKNEAEITKENRQAAKAVNFGLIYGMGSTGLKKYAKEKYQVMMSDEESDEFRKKFFETYKGLAQWHKKIAKSHSKETRTILGRRRLWVDRPRTTELYNSSVQGTGADIIKTALVLLGNKLLNTDAKIVVCVHDEIMIEVPKAGAVKYKEILVEAMVEAWYQIMTVVPIEVEAHICNNWADK